MRNSVVIVAFVAMAVMFVAQVQAQTPANGTSVLVQVESQMPAEQVPAIQAPMRYIVPGQAVAASTPVWVIKRKFLGYRAKPAWLHSSLVAPAVVPAFAPTVVAPQPIVVPPPAVQLPQPIIRYTPSVEWR